MGAGGSKGLYGTRSGSAGKRVSAAGISTGVALPPAPVASQSDDIDPVANTDHEFENYNEDLIHGRSTARTNGVRSSGRAPSKTQRGIQPAVHDYYRYRITHYRY